MPGLFHRAATLERVFMVQTIKSWLYRRLGRERYLKLVSQIYFLAYRSGWLRRKPEYQCHYYVRQLIRPGDYIIDIGANLGYYTVLFAEWTGIEGKVFSVEPVPLYRRILAENTARLPQVVILPYALGPEAAKVKMGVPGDAPYRHGLTRILNREEATAVAQTFEVEVKPPLEVFDKLPRLNYLKCDVEGYEGEVLPAMHDLLKRHRPIVQVELARENKAYLFNMMKNLDYRAYYLSRRRLVEIERPEQYAFGDWIFMPMARGGANPDHA